MNSEEVNTRRIAEMTEAEIHGVVEQLTAYAARLIGSKRWRFGKAGLLPGGRSLDDIVHAAFENVLKGGEWAEDKPLWLVLQGYVRGLVGRLAISCENQLVTGIDDKRPNSEESWGSAVEAMASPEVSPVEIIQRANDDVVLLEILDAFDEGAPERLIVESIISGAPTRAEVLSDTGLSKGEYEAAKKRLRRFLEKYRQQLEKTRQ